LKAEFRSFLQLNAAKGFEASEQEKKFKKRN
jgi:hypothetical protein